MCLVIIKRDGAQYVNIEVTVLRYVVLCKDHQIVFMQSHSIQRFINISCNPSNPTRSMWVLSRYIRVHQYRCHCNTSISVTILISEHFQCTNP